MSMKQMARNYKELWLVAVVFFSSLIMELLNFPIGQVHNLYIESIDGAWPFFPPLIIVYHIFMPLVLLLAFLLWWKQEKELYYQFNFRILTGHFMAYVTFVFFQTEVPRADVLGLLQGDDIFTELVRLTYSVDSNYCGFPSLHVILCTLGVVTTLVSKRLQLWLKIILIFMFSLISLTTLFVKQHVFLDYPAGLVYGAIAWFIGPYVLRLYRKIVSGKKNKAQEHSQA